MSATNKYIDSPEARRRITQRVTVVGGVINIALSALKIVFGWLGQSQALVADGIHSLSDVVTDALVLAAAHHANAEPDEEHPYGHLRFETVATFVLAVLLVITAIGLGWGALSRLLSKQETGVPALYTLLIAFVSIVVKEGMYWYTLRAAKKLNSELLKANAWHHRSDSVSSVVVLVGLFGAVMGYPYLDGIAAIIVAAMIMYVALVFGWSSLQELADKGADEQTLVKLRKQINAVDGVNSLHMLRTRLSARKISVDAHILVSPDISVSEGHSISDTVITQVKLKFPDVNDITVHVDAEDDEDAKPTQNLPLRDEATKEILDLWRGIAGIEHHEKILFHYLYGRIGIDLFLPLDNFESVVETSKLTEELQRTISPERYSQVKIYYG